MTPTGYRLAKLSVFRIVEVCRWWGSERREVSGRLSAFVEP